MSQPTLFDGQRGESTIAVEQVLLFALGDFQARGKVLAERDLPLDRLRGAFKRACESLGIDELTDEQAVAALNSLGAKVKRVPSFVAKHPFRVIVPAELARRAVQTYEVMFTSIERDN